MSENQKNDSKKSFLQRNLFLIVIFLIIITVAGGYLYRNNLLIFDEAQFSKLNQETFNFINSFYVNYICHII